MTRRRTDTRITWIVDFMHRHIAEPLTIEALAARINVPPTRFAVLFAAQTGVAPMQYLERARLRRARLLVERSFLSVNEIMTLVGYQDPDHFARDFAREHGVAPGELRTEGLTTSLPTNPSDGRPTKNRPGRPRARDPGFASA